MNCEPVSVIIPTYNRAEYLKDAIVSVLAQTYRNFELLILDNSSSDYTPKVIESFRDTRIKYIRHQCNIGDFANWAYGIHWAQYRFLSILADDDKYRPDFLARRIQAFSKADNVAAVFSAYDISDATGRIISKSPLWKEKEEIIDGRKLVSCAASGGVWSIVTTMYRTEIVQNLWEHTFRAGKAGDTALNIRIALNPRNCAVWLPDADVIYRRHPGQDCVVGGKQVLLDCIRAHKGPLENGEGAEYRSILNRGVVWANNILGRNAWDSGQVKLARRYFTRELLADPFQYLTWLRLLRTFIVRPIPIQMQKQDIE